MRNGRLVTRFGPIKKVVSSTLKRLNECQQVTQKPQNWEIFIGTSEGMFPSVEMVGIASDILLGRKPPQQVVIFESETEAYIAVCHVDFIPQIKNMAATTDSEKILAYVRQLAPKGYHYEER